MRDLFLLDPEVIFLNHGSFGATPAAVFEVYQRWQRELERQPVEFLGRRYDDLLRQSRIRLAAYVHTDPANLVYLANATAGVNTVARSLKLAPGDQILITDHEYGACENAWRYVCDRSGAELVRQSIPLPLPEPTAIVDLLWQKVTPQTKLIHISHITSPTGLIFPVEEICKRARAAGILTLIDGAHVPGQLPLNLDELGADFYTGNLHKWLCAPKGSALLYVRPEHQPQIAPLVVGWGYTDQMFSASMVYTTARSFPERHQWLGTLDPAAWLSVPAAIDFQEEHHWDDVRQVCHGVAIETQSRLAELTGLSPVVPETAFGQMVIAPLPPCDPLVLKQRLYDEYKVEVPITTWNGQHYVRVSIQGYNTRADVDKLMDALKALLEKTDESADKSNVTPL